ncbi:hypothetical protein F2Q69_00036966 [Brassica cretica]|uniref:Uncharacterized protein n=1 Tax=Brassica cretica TaxID=69181 RepID=A0A8S9SHZ9_BRACR|nr:hypothetical protein F2Q69_00036966 [Brassica cretica]
MVLVCTEVISDHIRSPLEITSLERNLALYRATKQRRKLEGTAEDRSTRDKRFFFVSLDYTKCLEPEPLRDAFYGHERTYTLERDVRRDAPSHPPKLHDISERE